MRAGSNSCIKQTAWEGRESWNSKRGRGWSAEAPLKTQWPDGTHVAAWGFENASTIRVWISLRGHKCLSNLKQLSISTRLGNDVQPHGQSINEASRN